MDIVNEKTEERQHTVFKETGVREKWSQFNPRIVRRLVLVAQRIVRGRRFILSEKKVIMGPFRAFFFPEL